MAEVKTRYGAMSAPDIRSDIVGRFLDHCGEWAWDEVQFVASVLPDGARVLDVGAFLGTFGLGLALHRPLGSIVFVEANAGVLPSLRCNVRRNATVPAVAIEALVADAGAARGRVGHRISGNLGSTSYALDAAGDVVAETPKTILSLAQLRAEHGPFDLVKLDVEGMELEILRSDAEALAGGGTALWVECTESVASVQVAELLLSWGLDLHYFGFPSHNPDNLRGASDPIFPFAFEAGLLAAPRSTPILDDALRRHGCLLAPIRSGEDLRKALWRTPRWGLPEWHRSPVEQVAALAGRALRGDEEARFLAPGWRPGRMLWDRVAELETVLEAERRREAEARTREGARRARDEAQRLSREGVIAARTAEAAVHRREAEALLAEVGALRESAVAERRGLEDARAAAETALAETAALALDRLAEIGQLRRERSALRDAATEAMARADRLSADAERLAGLKDEAARLRPLVDEVARLRLLEDEAARLRPLMDEVDRLRPLEEEAARLRPLVDEVDRLRAAQGIAARRLLEVERAFAERERQLETVVRSTTWRLARPAHRAVEAVPLAHRLLRFGRHLGGRAVRALRRRGGPRRA